MYIIISIFIVMCCYSCTSMNKEERKAKQRMYETNYGGDTNEVDVQITTQTTTNAIITSTTNTTIKFSNKETTTESNLSTTEIASTTNAVTAETVVNAEVLTCEPEDPIQDELQTEDCNSQTEAVNAAEGEIRDAIVIQNNVISIFYGEASQENVDEHDVVQDTNYFSDYSSTFLFGHNYGSFSCLKFVNVGDVIILLNDGVEKKFVVTRSEKAVVSGYDIQSCSDGIRMVYNDFEYENIRLFTCLDESPDMYRWVVIGKKIE